MDSNLPRLQLELYKEIKKVNQIAFSLWDLDVFSQETKMCLAPFFFYIWRVSVFICVNRDREKFCHESSVMKIWYWILSTRNILSD